MLYSEEEEREMAQFIHDCQVQGQIPTTALKFWEPFAATVSVFTHDIRLIEASPSIRRCLGRAFPGIPNQA